MKNKKNILSLVVCLVVASIGFYGGILFSNSKNSPNQSMNRQENFSQNGGRRPIQGMRSGTSGGLVSGEVLSLDAQSIIVKLRDGGSKIIFFSPSTKIEKTVDALTTDVLTGKTIMVNGSANSDGSINATSIQIRS